MSYTNGLDKPSDYFNTKLYTGTGSAQSITGVGFQPEMSWFKQRNTTRGHVLEDIVRGAGNALFPHDSSSETAGGYYLTSFDSDGFTLPSSNVGTNENSGTYASWNWLAGGTASSNTDGSITSSVSANTTAGFSVVTTTGTGSNATIGHGLGAAPAMIIGKRRDSGSSDWRVYNKNLSSNSHILFLNNTNAEQSGNSATWNNTAPTSSVFSVGTSGDVNASGGTFVFYCFADVKGYSKFGSYTGNGSTDGTFVYTGFKPAMVMGKSISGEDWWIFDNKRDTFNLTQKKLRPNSTAAENDNASKGIDLLSNGFKLRNSNGEFNSSGTTYIYMAFAEAPFVNSNGVPCNAR